MPLSRMYKHQCHSKPAALVSLCRRESVYPEKVSVLQSFEKENTIVHNMPRAALPSHMVGRPPGNRPQDTQLQLQDALHSTDSP